MARYSEEFKASVVQKMMPPNNVPVAQLSRETGITEATLYTWRKKTRAQGVPVPGDGLNPEQWRSEDKFAVVLETAALNETELSEYCRKKGLFPEQIAQWKTACLTANAEAAEQRKLLAEERKQDKKIIKNLERELNRKDKALAETAALLVLAKKNPRDLGGARGRLISLQDRKNAVNLIEQTMEQGARQLAACQVLGLSVRTFQRWKQEDNVKVDGRKTANRPAPANKLTESECQAILAACNEPRFQSLPPSQIVPTLLDEGRYIASVSSYYRVLKAKGQQHRRGRVNASGGRKPTSYVAKGPNQVWSWDITYVRSNIKGQFYYLYMVEDIFSRMIVAWEIHETESADHAAEMISKACLKHDIGQLDNLLVLHSDNGSPMKGATMLSTLQRLGIVPSFSRPRVSNDNPFSESTFRTMKYRPDYPTKPFGCLTEAREWSSGFVTWYNEEHKHSSLKFVTPSQRHYGEAKKCLSQREKLMEQAKARNPERWGSRSTRDWSLQDEVWLNPERSEACIKPLVKEAA
ncbi:IS3 family transposase [Endozoicomonas numazuensis]|uniref:IS3 family transposase n=1 Tax=Endozoicomonas numazuensis TaxID=1137799 RepID=UPI001EFFE785|nr:IS3 family transposase [Endozoicomonas numazuensis]